MLALRLLILLIRNLFISPLKSFIPKQAILLQQYAVRLFIHTALKIIATGQCQCTLEIET